MATQTLWLENIGEKQLVQTHRWCQRTPCVPVNKNTEVLKDNTHTVTWTNFEAQISSLQTVQAW